MATRLVITALLNAAGVTDSDAKTALLFAAESNPNPDTIAALVGAGLNVDATMSDGRTSLMLAAEFNQNPAVISALLVAGANAKLKSSEGKTALEYAEENPKLKGTQEYLELKSVTR